MYAVHKYDIEYNIFALAVPKVARSESNHNPSQSSARWFSYLWDEVIVETVINNQSITRNESPHAFRQQGATDLQLEQESFTPLSCSSSRSYRQGIILILIYLISK